MRVRNHRGTDEVCDCWSHHLRLQQTWGYV